MSVESIRGAFSGGGGGFGIDLLKRGNRGSVHELAEVTGTGKVTWPASAVGAIAEQFATYQGNSSSATLETRYAGGYVAQYFTLDHDALAGETITLTLRTGGTSSDAYAASSGAELIVDIQPSWSTDAEYPEVEGTPLGTSTEAASVTNIGPYTDFDVTVTLDSPLTAGTRYWVVLHCPGSGSSVHEHYFAATYSGAYDVGWVDNGSGNDPLTNGTGTKQAATRALILTVQGPGEREIDVDVIVTPAAAVYEWGTVEFESNVVPTLLHEGASLGAINTGDEIPATRLESPLTFRFHLTADDWVEGKQLFASYLGTEPDVNHQAAHLRLVDLVNPTQSSSLSVISDNSAHFVWPRLGDFSALSIEPTIVVLDYAGSGVLVGVYTASTSGQLAFEFDGEIVTALMSNSSYYYYPPYPLAFKASMRVLSTNANLPNSVYAMINDDLSGGAV